MANRAANGDRPTILVVEDEPGVRESIALLLEIEDFRVLTAVNGRDALEQLSSVSCDVIVTDYMMPVMNGEALVRRLRDDLGHGAAPIVLMSSGLPPGTTIRPLVDAFLLKPFTIEQLVRVIEKLLSRER